MDTTYARLVRLAYTKPEFRPKLMPLLLKYAAPDYNKYRERKKKKGEQPLSRKEWHAKVMSTGEAQTKEMTPRKEQYNDNVNKIMDQYKLHDEDAEEVVGYKRQLPKKGGKKKRSPEQIKQDFLQHTKNPETKKRVQEMNAADFGKLLAWIMEDEEGGGEGMGKGASASLAESTLRKATIKLAHQQPELRHVLLPLLTRTAAGPGRPAGPPRATGAELFNVYVGPKDWSDILKEVRLFSDPDTVKLLLQIAEKVKAALEPSRNIAEALKALYILANYPRKALGAGFFQSKENRAGLMHAFVRQVASKVGLHSSDLSTSGTEYTPHPGARFPGEAELEATSGGAMPWTL